MTTPSPRRIAQETAIRHYGPAATIHDLREYMPGRWAFTVRKRYGAVTRLADARFILPEENPKP
jgi:hypothetical protein